MGDDAVEITFVSRVEEVSGGEAGGDFGFGKDGGRGSDLRRDDGEVSGVDIVGVEVKADKFRLVSGGDVGGERGGARGQSKGVGEVEGGIGGEAGGDFGLGKGGGRGSDLRRCNGGVTCVAAADVGDEVIGVTPVSVSFVSDGEGKLVRLREVREGLFRGR